MLLFVFLGLIANVAFLSGECDFGTLKLKDFDWNKFGGARPWYAFFHFSNDIENNIDCFKVTISRPAGNVSLLTFEGYVISEKRHNKTYGYATNWKNNGYFETYYPVPMWNGHAYIIAVDYKRYVIMKHCSLNSSKLNIYVGFRSKHPDETTMRDVLKELQDNNIAISKLAMSGTDYCEQEESSTLGSVSP